MEGVYERTIKENAARLGYQIVKELRGGEGFAQFQIFIIKEGDVFYYQNVLICLHQGKSEKPFFADKYGGGEVWSTEQEATISALKTIIKFSTAAYFRRDALGCKKVARQILEDVQQLTLFRI